LILCSKKLEARARRRRKSLGGGMRQAGFLAAAGIYALEHNRERLSEDHRRAKRLGAELLKMSWVSSVMPVDTNIIIFELASGLETASVLSGLSERGLRAVAFGPSHIRMVTHLDITDDHLQVATDAIRTYQP
jgi:threonine aldolase